MAAQIWSKVLSWLQPIVSVVLPPPKFPSETMERRFIYEHAKRATPQRRAGLLVALATWVAYIGWDIFNASASPDFRKVFWGVVALRGLGTIAIAVGVFLSRKPRFAEADVAERIISAIVFVCFSILLSMIIIVNFPLNYLYYYVGLLLVFLFAFGLFGMRARTIALVLAVCFSTSVVILPFATLGPDNNTPHARLYLPRLTSDRHDYLNVVSSYYYLAAVSYLASFLLAGCAIASELERNSRSAFAREVEMAASNAAILESRRDSESKTVALIAAKEKLRSLAEQENVNKSRFLADAAHDLSQPLHAVSLLMESTSHALNRNDVNKSKELIAAASRAVQTTRSSFKSVLEISQLESGLVQPVYSNFDVENLIAEIIEPLTVLAEARGVRIRVRRPHKHVPVVHSDRVMLGRIMSNLVSNAIKYSDPTKADRQAVVVAVVPLSNRIRLDVLDNGVGIPEAKWPEVFKAFVQLENPERNRDKGLGLGLSIVAATVALLEEHRLDMRSAERRWTRFSLEVPRHYGTLPSTSGEYVGHAKSEYDLTSLFAWYVEDDEIVREATAAFLNEVGLLVEVASSLEDLESKLEFIERRPDLIISDYRLPNGRTAADVVRVFANVWGERIPMLVLTGEVTQGTLLLTILAEKNVVIEKKPVAPDVLVDAIKRLCFGNSADSVRAE